MHINLLLIHSIDEKVFLPTDFKGFFCALHFLPDFHLSSSSPSLSKPDFCCCEIRSVDFFANWSATLWTFLQIYGQLLSFLRLPAAIHPLVCDVPSVFELHEIGLRVILSAKKKSLSLNHDYKCDICLCICLLTDRYTGGCNSGSWHQIGKMECNRMAHGKDYCSFGEDNAKWRAQYTERSAGHMASYTYCGCCNFL